MMDKIKFGALVIVALVSAVSIWSSLKPVPPVIGETKTATPEPALKKISKTAIAPKKVVVYEPSAKTDLGLPPSVVANPDTHVQASSVVKCDDSPVRITTLIDSKTGESTTVEQALPKPWFAAESKSEIRLDYGIKNELARVLRLSAHMDAIRVKSLHAGVNASVDSDGSSFAGGGVGYKF